MYRLSRCLGLKDEAQPGNKPLYFLTGSTDVITENSSLSFYRARLINETTIKLLERINLPTTASHRERFQSGATVLTSMLEDYSSIHFFWNKSFGLKRDRADLDPIPECWENTLNDHRVPGCSTGTLGVSGQPIVMFLWIAEETEQPCGTPYSSWATQDGWTSWLCGGILARVDIQKRAAGVQKRAAGAGAQVPVYVEYVGFPLGSLGFLQTSHRIEHMLSYDRSTILSQTSGIPASWTVCVWDKYLPYDALAFQPS